MAGKCLVAALMAAAVVFGGCVERELKVNTVPTGATVVLNDEEIGQGPVITSFEWYGDYRVRVTKPGYETLVTHRKLKRPLHDRFPFDFFAQVIWPFTIRDKYEWTFELKPYEAPTREQLLQGAEWLKQDSEGK